MESPPSVITRRGNGPEGTPDRLGLSSSTAPWQALNGGPGRGRYGVGPCVPWRWRVHTVAAAATDCPAESTAPRPGLRCPRACRLRLAPGCNKVDGRMEDFCSIGVPGGRHPHCHTSPRRTSIDPRGRSHAARVCRLRHRLIDDLWSHAQDRGKGAAGVAEDPVRRLPGAGPLREAGRDSDSLALCIRLG